MTPGRREFLEGVATVAAARWQSDELEIDNVDEWEPIRSAVYETGEVEADSLSAMGQAGPAHWRVGDDDIEERILTASYDEEGPRLAVAGRAEGGLPKSESLARLTPDQARELAAALYQAAEEYDRREVADEAE